MIPVSVITGYLGSGKTTLLARLLRDPSMSRTAVIINEFGEVGLDHELVETSDESFIQLSNGCLCCNVRSDLVLTLGDLAARRAAGTVPAFERVVIETTGLADPAPILHALMTDRALNEVYAFDSVVTTVDAVTGLSTLEQHDESLRQAAVADKLLITKTDLQPQTDVLVERLRDMNPDAAIVEVQHGAIEAAELFGATDQNGSRIARLAPSGMTPPPSSRRTPGPKDQNGFRIDRLAPSGMTPPPSSRRTPGPKDQNGFPIARLSASRMTLGYSSFPREAGIQAYKHLDRITSFCITRDEPIRAVTLALFLSGLAENCGADLLRMKGLVNVLEEPERPAVIHGVQHVYHAPVWLERWPSDDRRTRMVFIGRGIPEAWVRNLLELLEEEVADETLRHSGVRQNPWLRDTPKMDAGVRQHDAAKR